jgi:HNH endonuclease
MTRLNLPISERISQHIISKENCWITDFSCNSNGYPMMTINRKFKLVSRVMYELHFGSITDKMCVCHKCDNSKCVNPNHLFLGTQKDNMTDMISKGRKASTKGSLHGNSKLDEEKILEIKKLLAEKNLSQKEIGKKYCVSDTVISLIKNGHLWNHVKSQPTHITNISNISNIFNAPVTINYSEAKQLSLFDTDEFK